MSEEVNWINQYRGEEQATRKMADLEAVLADVSYLMAMEMSKQTPESSKKIILPDPRWDNVESASWCASEFFCCLHLGKLYRHFDRRKSVNTKNEMSQIF